MNAPQIQTIPRVSLRTGHGNTAAHSAHVTVRTHSLSLGGRGLDLPGDGSRGPTAGAGAGIRLRLELLPTQETQERIIQGVRGLGCKLAS